MKNIFDYNMRIWVAMNDRLNESVDNEDVNEGLKDVNPMNEGWDNENPDDWDDFDLTPEEQIEKAIKNREFYVISYEDPSHKEWEFCGSYKSRENAINTADACVGAPGTYAVVYDCNKKMVYDAISDKAGDEYEFDDED